VLPPVASTGGILCRPSFQQPHISLLRFKRPAIIPWCADYVVGTRITQVIPSDGGRGPDVVSVGEKWFSPELKITVLSKYKNTNTGSDETITEIRQIDRSEPDATLFEIPTDYQIVK
jgi:hypothetical protein